MAGPRTLGDRSPIIGSMGKAIVTRPKAEAKCKISVHTIFVTFVENFVFNEIRANIQLKNL